MSVFKEIVDGFEDFWDKHIKPFLASEIEPLLKTFMQQFDTVFGQHALQAAFAAIGRLEQGESFGKVAADLTAKLLEDAKNDVHQIVLMDTGQALQVVQSAMQIAKSAGNIATPADQNITASISA